MHAYQYEIAICAIFKDEAPYLKEWIEFHKLVGVEHFYLYNHDSSDNYLKVLKSYIDRGDVTIGNMDAYKDCEHLFVNNFNWLQCHVYLDCAKNVAGIAKWVAFLDIDEFLFPVKAFYLKDVLRDYEDCPGIGVNWQMFGTSNVEKIPKNKLLIETLIRCAPKDYAGNLHVKTISKPDLIVNFVDPHTPIFTGMHQVSSDKIPFPGAKSPYVQVDKLRINHYWTRDEYYLKNYKIPRRQNWGENADAILNANKEMNQKRSTQIMKYVPLLKKLISLKR
jgi:hypothetical protein